MSKNIQMIEGIADGLEELKKSVVFVGGATASLYFADESSIDIRPTDDVDCIIEIASNASYMRLAEQLYKMGFSPDSSVDAPICRFKFSGIKVDIMPTDEEILGFSNQWYQEGFEKRIKYNLPNGQEIYILPLPYFLATKIEAFKDRGADDPRFSHDLEDIVIILVNVKKEQLLEDGSVEVNSYVRETFKSFLDDPEIVEAISSQNPYPEIDGALNKILDALNI